VITEPYHHTLPELTWSGDRLCMLEEGKAIPLQCRYCRPQSDPKGPVVIRQEKQEGKEKEKRPAKEVALLPSLDVLPDEQRALVERDLELRYPMPRIVSIEHVFCDRGKRLLEVTTDAGPTSFLIRDPSASLQTLPDGYILISDLAGNRYRIHPESLSERSYARWLQVV